MNEVLAAKPNFYMSSCEYELLKEPRKCYAIRKFTGGDQREFLLIRIEPPIPAGEVEGYDNEVVEVVVRPRHVGVSMFPITKWPVYVHVVLPVVQGISYRGAFDSEIGKLYSESWAELYPTEEKARAKRP